MQRQLVESFHPMRRRVIPNRELIVTDAVPRSRYLFDNAGHEAAVRFESLSALYDTATRRHLERLGISAGWRCLEVGAGGGSVASFMSERVGGAGSVLATDINIGRMPAALPPNVEVRQHDIGTDSLPERTFDLVHARAVLLFVPERHAAMRRMVAALKPGGWLLLEEILPYFTDVFSPPDDPDAELVRRARRSVRVLMRRSGGDPLFASRLPTAVAALGLVDFGAEGYFVPLRTPAVVELVRANIDQTSAAIIDAGLMTGAELSRYREFLARPESVYPVSSPLVSVWGRRPW